MTIPRPLRRKFSDPHTAAAGRAMQAMLRMGKVDVSELERAFRGNLASA
jgi:hypothetical protein